ncbi:hypothetical protein V1288_000218 [Bradyrhizobium sp. AZCC 2176]
MLPLPCMLVCSFVCANRTRDRGCSKHPVFPAPSISKRANEDAHLGRDAPREREGAAALTMNLKFFRRPCVRRNDGYTGSAIEYFTWLNAKLDSIEAMPSSRVSLFFRNAS